eukprot:TRINITY_DN8282_c2_g1_i2.p1 TRINITY_DN8282_c2_g1~~TRINITY_DN8282_c2_g1_i2.p1  ORF type:complete len:517 (-),score=42.09 TRINITY_DN8282_c2_g1_i2:108-1658(-)
MADEVGNGLTNCDDAPQRKPSRGKRKQSTPFKLNDSFAARSCARARARVIQKSVRRGSRSRCTSSSDQSGIVGAPVTLTTVVLGFERCHKAVWQRMRDRGLLYVGGHDQERWERSLRYLEPGRRIMIYASKRHGGHGVLGVGVVTHAPEKFIQGSSFLKSDMGEELKSLMREVYSDERYHEAQHEKQCLSTSFKSQARWAEECGHLNAWTCGQRWLSADHWRHYIMTHTPHGKRDTAWAGSFRVQWECTTPFENGIQNVNWAACAAEPTTLSSLHALMPRYFSQNQMRAICDAIKGASRKCDTDPEKRHSDCEHAFVATSGATRRDDRCFARDGNGVGRAAKRRRRQNDVPCTVIRQAEAQDRRDSVGSTDGMESKDGVASSRMIAASTSLTERQDASTSASVFAQGQNGRPRWKSLSLTPQKICRDSSSSSSRLREETKAERDDREAEQFWAQAFDEDERRQAASKAHGGDKLHQCETTGKAAKPHGESSTSLECSKTTSCSAQAPALPLSSEWE